MKILIGLTYYRPHTSGLTIYAERLAKAFVHRGHQVTILTSQYDPSLPRDEIRDGVKIIRVPVAFRLSKGVIMPTFGSVATILVRENDWIQLHLPQFDAAGIAYRGKRLKKPTILTYHCDLSMPAGVLSWLANQAVHTMNHLAAGNAHRIVTYTQDYADNSHFLKKYTNKLAIIPPPVDLPNTTENLIREFAQRNNPENKKPVIGMAARFATEKGVEVLVDAMPDILAKFPNALVQFAGPFQNIIGEEKYSRRLMPLIQKFIDRDQWRFVGVLNPEKMAAFYPNIDCLVLPSLNSTEAFGLVQIEAMMNGKPVVASDLPGVRQPALMHKMGEIIAIGDAKALANAVVSILGRTYANRGGRKDLEKKYDPDAVAAAYEELFAEIQNNL